MTRTLRRPLKRVAPRLGALIDLGIWFGALMGAAVISTLIQRSHILGVAATPVLTLALWLVMFLVAGWLVHRRGATWRSIAFQRPVPFASGAALVVGGYVAAIMVNAALALFVFPRLGLPHPSLKLFAPLAHHLWAYLGWLFVALSSAAMGEELQFRGFLWSRLETLFGRGRVAALLALVAQALLFGLGHIYQGLGGALATGALGLVLGAIFLFARRNLVPCMVLHGLIDTISLTVIFLMGVPAAVAAP